MDNNPLNQTPQPATPTQQAPNMTPLPQQPSGVVQSPPVSTEGPKSSKKMVLMLVGGLLVAIILVGGAYLYVNSRGTDQSKLQTPPQTQDTLETELNQVNVEDLEEEFATVEADLQNL